LILKGVGLFICCKVIYTYLDSKKLKKWLFGANLGFYREGKIGQKTGILACF